MPATRARIPNTFEDSYLPLTELATYAGLSVRTLRDYLRDASHPLPHYHIGGRTLVKRSEYDEWARTYRDAAPDHDLDASAVAALQSLHEK